VADVERAVVRRLAAPVPGQELLAGGGGERGVHRVVHVFDSSTHRTENRARTRGRVHTGQVIKLQLLMSGVTFALWVFCLVGVIGSPANAVRNLPKAAWVLLVLLVPLAGSIAWLVAGRPQGKARRATPAPPSTRLERDRPRRPAAGDPHQDEEFRRRVRERAEEQRRRHEQSRRSRDEQPDRSGPAGPPDRRQPTEEPGEPAGSDAGEVTPK
jgi:hypothetical protein